MQLTEHFSLEEFIQTDYKQFDNTLPDHLMANAIQTCEMMEIIRAHLSDLKGVEVPIIPSSGYRCLPLNRHLKSKDWSDHVQAHAMDWTAPSFGTPYQICRALQMKVGEFHIGQLIHEYGRWVHTGWPITQKAANRVITISNAGTFSGIRMVS